MRNNRKLQGDSMIACRSIAWRLLAAVLLIGHAARAQEPPSNRLANLAFVSAQDDTWLKAHGNDSNIFLRPGLRADRAQREVVVWAEATGLSESSPVEFFLVAPESGHDYEAAAISFAKPSDIHAALEFIGMRPGRPIAPAENQFWPKGERVLVECEWTNSNGTVQRMPLENLCYDKQRRAPMPAKGLVFTGSYRSEKHPPTNNYAADLFAPNAIAGNYNDAALVLDVPWRAGQSEIYGNFTGNPAAGLRKGQMIRCRMTPEYTDGRLRVANLHLSVTHPSSNAAPSIKELIFTLTNRDTGAKLATGPLHAILAQFNQFKETGRDPFVVIEFDGNLPLESVVTAARFLYPLDDANGIRIEAPPAGHPYIKSFAPEDKLRSRAERPSQPWELQLSTNTAIIGILTKIHEDYDETTRKSTFTTEDFTVATPIELQMILRKKEWPKVVFIYAAKKEKYSRARAIYERLAATHPIVYFFID